MLATVKVVPVSTLKVPWLVPRAMPLFELSVKSAEECNVPPFNVRCPAVAEPGAAPNPLSALILIVPALIVVDPEYVLVPERVKVPESTLVNVPEPAIIPPYVKVVPELTSIIPLLAPRAMPRFELSVKSVEDSKVPPFKVR